MLCTHKTTSSASLVLKFVLSSTTHISTNSRPFLVGIVSRSEENMWESLELMRSRRAHVHVVKAVSDMARNDIALRSDNALVATLRDRCVMDITAKVFKLSFGVNRFSSRTLGILGHDADNRTFIMSIDKASSLNNGKVLQGVRGNSCHVYLLVKAGLENEKVRPSQATIGASIHEGSSSMAIVTITMDTVGPWMTMVSSVSM